MTFSEVSATASFIHEQGSPHKDYLYHLFDVFKSFSDKLEPIEYSRLDKRNGVTSYSYYFNTISLGIFYHFATLFYVRVPDTRKVIKLVPALIGELLTPRALAYWIMDDGQYVKRGGLTLCTDSFTLEEVMLLKGVLQTKFGLSCTLHKKGKNKRIYISGLSMPQLNLLVGQYMHPSFMYKLGK